MAGHPIRDTALMFVTAILSYGGSCASDSGGTYEPGSNGGYPNDRSGDYRSNDSYYDSDRPNRIPRSADVVREGTGKLKWQADLNGTIYVFDRDKNEISYIGPVQRGSEIVVRPDDDQITVAGRVVYDQNLRKDGFHQLYFVSDRRRLESVPTRSPDRVTEAPATHRPAVDPVPAGSTRLAHGSGVLTITQAPQAGSVIVYDETAGKIVFQGSLRKGASFRVVPSEGQIYANSKPIGTYRAARGQVLAVYFQGK